MTSWSSWLCIWCRSFCTRVVFISHSCVSALYSFTMLLSSFINVIMVFATFNQLMLIISQGKAICSYLLYPCQTFLILDETTVVTCCQQWLDIHGGRLWGVPIKSGWPSRASEEQQSTQSGVFCVWPNIKNEH